MTVAITGSSGLIGTHFRAHLKAKAPEVGVHLVDRNSVLNGDNTSLGNAETLVHLGFLNRGDDEEIEYQNLKYTEALIQCLSKSHVKRIVFSNSIHKDSNTTYGRVKSRVDQTLRSWCQQNQRQYLSLTLPHIFGEFGKPNHNSFVSTICWSFAQSREIRVDPLGNVELLHASEVARVLIDWIKSPFNSQIHSLALKGSSLNIGDIYNTVSSLVENYSSGIIPALPDLLTINLFNTYRSYLSPQSWSQSLLLKSDARGHLVETCKSFNMGQTFVSTTLPGHQRGNHFHLSKFERFCVVSGEALIRIRPLHTGVITEFRVSGDRPEAIDIPTLSTHSIEGLNERPFTTLFWTNSFFNPEDPDTFPEKV